jgi:hypothetical protein
VEGFTEPLPDNDHIRNNINTICIYVRIYTFIAYIQAYKYVEKHTYIHVELNTYIHACTSQN